MSFFDKDLERVKVNQNKELITHIKTLIDMLKPIQEKPKYKNFLEELKAKDDSVFQELIEKMKKQMLDKKDSKECTFSYSFINDDGVMLTNDQLRCSEVEFRSKVNKIRDYFTNEGLSCFISEVFDDGYHPVLRPHAKKDECVLNLSKSTLEISWAL